MTEPKPDYKVHAFKNPEVFRAWLQKNHAVSPGIWLRFFKKGSGAATIVYAEALDEALCYGWIDSQVKKYDERSYIQKFTPRRNRSIWSKVNTEKAERLIKEGRMQSAGFREVEAARNDGRWKAAYASPKNAEIPPDFAAALRKNKKAGVFFGTLTKANRYAITWRLHTAKRPETREKRIKQYIEMLERGKKVHP